MKKAKRIISIICSLALLTTMGNFVKLHALAKQEDPLSLTFTNVPDIESYSDWEKESLPIGNGGIGANVFGAVEKECIHLNEKSLWSGGPANGRDYNGGNIEENGQNGQVLKQVQQLFIDGKIDEAMELCNSTLLGSGDGGYGFYLSYGSMFFDFDYGTDDVVYSNFKRTLDIENAVVTVEYDVNGTHYTRKSFVSYPDNVLVTNITAKGGDKLNFAVTVVPDNTPGDASMGVTNNGYGRTWTTDIKDGFISINGELDDNQMKFSSHTKVVADGYVVDNDNDVTVLNSSDVTVYTTIATDYKMKYPDYRTGESSDELSARVKNYVNKAVKKGYRDVEAYHVTDHSNIYSRVKLDIGGKSDVTTDVLVDNYKNGTATAEQKRHLETLMYQYGRYLTIAASRETPEDDPYRQVLPTNLQGIWAGANNSRWHSDYHLNVNLQMNYWPTYVGNMAECAEPLINYVDSLREPGRVTAAIYAGIVSDADNPENGFMVHNQNTPFGWTCPGYVFSWGWSPAALAWIIQNCYEYYEYTNDTDYLREKIYPIMREAAVFFDQYLTRDNDGYLVSAPSFSPEHGPNTAGNTYEHALIWQLYEDTITAAELLDVDSGLVDIWRSNQSDLKGPIEIGDDGQIKEWYEETTIGSVYNYKPNHRHISHLLGLYPGDLITDNNSEYLTAAEISLVERDGIDGNQLPMGWALMHRAAVYARLGNADRAYQKIQLLINNLTYHNLWIDGPPFQIDASYGYTAGMSEMLIQSNTDAIKFLPAIPNEWENGSVSGLLTRGNFEVSMDWNNLRLAKVTVLSKDGGPVTLQYDNIATAKITDSKGNVVNATPISLDRVTFETTKSETYTISGIYGVCDTPKNIKAVRTSDNSIDVSWTKADGAVYDVYRCVKGGSDVRIATDVDGGKYTDMLYGITDTVYYTVIAKTDTATSKASAKAWVREYPSYGIVDDNSEYVSLGGSWKTWTSNTKNYGNTIKYINDPAGGETISLTFIGDGIEIYGRPASDRGYINVSIDGKDYGDIDTYMATAPEYPTVVFETDGLTHGVHTVTVTALGRKNDLSTRAKVEIDRFDIKNSEVVLPESIGLSSKTGALVITDSKQSLELVSTVSDVTWSSSDTDVLKVDENGTVTAGTQNGTATITATAVFDNRLTESIELSYYDASLKEYVVTTVDEAVYHDSAYIVNPQIVWSSGWSRPYTKESTRHYGTTKTESATTGVSFEYTFTGTGVQIGAQLNRNSGAYDVYIDGVYDKTVSLYSYDAKDQYIVYENMSLDFGCHTVKCVSREDEGRNRCSLDFIKTYMPKTMNVTVIDDCIDDSTRNPAITWSGAWNDPYTKQQAMHYNGEKTDTANSAETSPGSYFEYTFTGTGVEVITHKNVANGDLMIYLDGVYEKTVSLNSSSNVTQAIVYSNLGLENTEHTIKGVVATDSNGKYRSSLDAIRIYAPNTDVIIDKTELWNAVNTASALNSKYYDGALWEANSASLESAFSAALAVLNDSSTSKAETDGALGSLNTVLDAIGQPTALIPDIADKSVTAVAADSTNVFVKWDGVDDAVSYKVVCGSFSETVTDTSAHISGLSLDSEYTVSVYPTIQYLGTSVLSDTAVTATVNTYDSIAPDSIAKVDADTFSSSATLKWQPVQNAEAYNVYCDGRVYTVKDAYCEISELTSNTEYSVMIFATDANSNQSVPTKMSLVTAHDHQAISVSRVLPTQTQNGYRCYWYCSICGAYFEDEACTLPIADIEVWKITDGVIDKSEIPALIQNENLATLLTKDNVKKIYWGYIGTENTQYKWFDGFRSLCGDTFTADYDPENNETYPMTKAGFYRFVVVYEIDGKKLEDVYTFAVENEASIVPEIETSGIYAVVSSNGTNVKKLYYGYIGAEKTPYNWATFKEQAGDTFTADFSPKDQKAYKLSKKGYYRFVVVYVGADNKVKELVYTVYNEKESTGIPVVDATGNVITLNHNDAYSVAKMYVGFAGAEPVEIDNWSEFKSTVTSYYGVLNPADCAEYTLKNNGYYVIVVNYSNGSRNVDVYHTVLVA